MVKVDFYILQSSNHPSLFDFACRLTEKGYRLGHSIYIRTESQAQQKLIDDLLWTFRPGSFVPHNIWDESNDQSAPVLVGQDIDPPSKYTTLLNLNPSVIDESCPFERVIEIVNQIETVRKSARQRYRLYQNRGYSLTTHNIQP